MIIVTGANGFIGSAIVRELNHAGISDILCVDVVSLSERPEPLKKAKYKKFMLTNEFLSWAQDTSEVVHTVIHMGAISSTTETNWDKLVKNNIELSQILFQLCINWQAKYIYASSGAVYGDGGKGFSDQTSPTELTPLNLYGKSKTEFDIWALKQKSCPRFWAGVRFFNVYGPNEYHKNDMASVVYKAFLQIKTTAQLKLFKSHNEKYRDGEQLRDFVYIKDISRWVIELMNNDRFASGIYNMGYGQARTWADLAKYTFQYMQNELSIHWIEIPASIRAQYQYFTQADMKKSFSSGLSAPEYPLERGIQDYLENYLLTDDPYL